jgi:hypothetical protein
VNHLKKLWLVHAKDALEIDQKVEPVQGLMMACLTN